MPRCAGAEKENLAPRAAKPAPPRKDAKAGKAGKAISGRPQRRRTPITRFIAGPASRKVADPLQAALDAAAAAAAEAGAASALTQPLEDEPFDSSFVDDAASALTIPLEDEF